MKNRSFFLSLLAGLLLTLAAASAGAQTLTTLFTNGPTANRINLVVLSEGYQAAELSKFVSDARDAVKYLLSQTPYRDYSNFFNAFAIAVASPQSGSDHYTPTVSLVNTYFNSTFDSYGTQRLITIPPNDRDSNYANGMGKVNALLQALMPEYDMIILLVNDPQYGGSGGSVLISSLHTSSPEIVVHEAGHTFAGLADEYSSAYPGYNPVEKPNATTQTNRASIRWTSWIGSTTPIPTPQTSAYANLVGLFQGAQYQTTGWYRPKLDCKMNHLGVGYCEVCGEQIVKSTYQRVRVIDSCSPAASNVTITAAQPLSFSVATLQPQGHSLSYQWFTNGVAVAGATNAVFSLAPRSFLNGSHTLRVQVRDLTALVRNDPSSLLSSSTTWNLTVNLSPITLASARVLPGGRLAFEVTGTAPQGFVLQASSNLLTWVPVLTNSLTAGPFYYTNADPGLFPRRFYRTLANP